MLIGKPCESWETPKGMVRIWPKRRDLPQGDQEELDQLEERGGKEELTEAEIDRMEELEARATGFDDNDVAASTIWLHIDREGKIATFGPWKPTFRATAGEGADGVTRLETKGPPQSLLEDLARIRLASLQHRAASQPELLLDLLAWQLTGANSPWSQSLSVTANRQNITPEKPDGLDLPGTLADPSGLERSSQTPDGFAAFRALGKKHRNEILARGLARTLDPASDMRAMLATTMRPNGRAKNFGDRLCRRRAHRLVERQTHQHRRVYLERLRQRGHAVDGQLVAPVLEEGHHVRIRKARLRGDFSLGLAVRQVTNAVGDQPGGGGVLIGVHGGLAAEVGCSTYRPRRESVVGCLYLTLRADPMSDPNRSVAER